MSDETISSFSAPDYLNTPVNVTCGRHGWSGSLSTFAATEAAEIVAALQRFIPDVGSPQINAWRDSIHLMQTVALALVSSAPVAAGWSSILEYQMLIEARRADAVILMNGAVAILEFKGKSGPTDADIDQTHAYARDLRSYHDSCHDLPVHAVLVPTRSSRLEAESRGVSVRGPAALPTLLLSLADPPRAPLPLSRFLDADAYRPLPTLVAAARELIPAVRCAACTGLPRQPKARSRRSRR